MEKLTNIIIRLIRDELSNSQENRNNESAEYRLGKNEAYSKVLALITKILKE